MSAQTTQWILELIDKVTGPMKGVTTSIEKPLAGINKLELSSGKAMDAISSQVPGVGNAIGMLTNPYMLAAAGAAALGAAAYKSIDMALGWDSGLAKINVTAQLTKKELTGLSDELLAIGKNNVAPIEQIPDAFNKIISAGLDVNTSLQVLEPTLKAAKAGFADVGVVGNAAVSVMNSSGRDINEVYDVLFATLNKGKAEFGDVAQYLPKIIPDARKAGFALYETAGAWAYLTAQGQTAERSTTLIQNAMKALQDTAKIKSFKELGIDIYDSTGKIKPMISIVDQLAQKTRGLSDLDSANFYGKLGLDQEASAFFATASQDADKFRQIIDFTTHSQGQLGEAYKNSMTPLDSWHQLTNMLQGSMMQLGAKALPIIGSIGQGILDTIAYFKNLYNESALFRDILSGLGSLVEVSFNAIVRPIQNAWYFVKGLWGDITLLINQIGALGGGWENMYAKIKPIVYYMKDLFGQLATIMYKVITLDFKGAVESFKAFKMPNMADMQKRVTADNNASKISDDKKSVDLSKKGVTPIIPTKNLDFGKSGSGKGGLSGSGGGVGGAKTINQKIEIKNYFNVSGGGDVQSIAETVIRAINDRLRDATVALQ